MVGPFGRVPVPPSRAASKELKAFPIPRVVLAEPLHTIGYSIPMQQISGPEVPNREARSQFPGFIGFHGR
jgi:hypothetical protein